MSLENAKLLLEESKTLLSAIESLYNDSLSQKDIPDILHIRIKQFLESIRSSLDFSAFEIFSRYCKKNIPTDKLYKIEKNVYFPIKESLDKFNDGIDAIFAGLRAQNIDIVMILEKCQPFNTSSWLLHLNQLSNNNKHRDFTPQIRTEYKEVKMTSPSGGSVTWSASNVKFGPGVKVLGVPINPQTQMPAYKSDNKVEITTWVEFIFNDPKIPVLPTLKDFYHNALLVINQLDKVV